MLLGISRKHSTRSKEADSLSCHRWDSLTQSSKTWLWGKTL